MSGRVLSVRGWRNHSWRAVPLLAPALFMVLACGAPPAQNQNAAPSPTPQPSATQPPAAQQATPGASPAPSVSEVGDVRVTAITHASLQLEYGGKVIHVDPTSPGDYSAAKQADLVLITDIHPDHLDPAAVARIRKAGAPIVVPSAAAGNFEGPTVMANGETKTVAGVQIEAVPMYNIQRGPAPGEFYHPKGRGNGYILTLGARRVYLAGDTECTDEMRALNNIDAAFLPMNLPYTMPPSEVAECVRAFKPAVVFPYHYRGQNPQDLKTALQGEPVDVRLLEWYPAGQ